MAKAGRDVPDLLDDLIEWGELVASIRGSTDRERFDNDVVTRLALMKASETLGEISRRLLTWHPDWSADKPVLLDAYRYRNRITHGYDSIDWLVVWKVIEIDVPELTSRAREWRKEFPDR